MVLPRQLTTLDDVVRAVRDGLIRKVGVLLGAGVSVNSGIPDYRTAGTGLYSTLPEMLDRLTLSDAGEHAFLAEEVSRVVGRELFEKNQLPFLEAKRGFLIGLYEGRWRPTYAHHALRALVDAGVVQYVLTQNVDGFEAAAGLPADVVHQLHGGVQRAACHYCGAAHSTDDVLRHVRAKVKDITGEDPAAPDASEPLLCHACGRPGVRPSVVLYDEPLAEDFDARVNPLLADLDLLVVMGTSLTVAPVCDLPARVPHSCYRMVVNATKVGEDVGLRYGRGRDVLVLADCDAAMRRLTEGLALDVAGGAGSTPAAALPPTADGVVGGPGRRIECVVRCEGDLARVLVHSREAAICVPSVDVDLSSHITSGVPRTLREFLAVHAGEVEKHMQMVMGGGGAAQVQSFIRELRALADEAAMPWTLIVDDPAGEATLSARPCDTLDTYRVTPFALTARERRQMGLGDE